jgi:Ca2+-binding RTX toxin-like protein
MATINGTNSNDTLTGFGGADQINGLGGNDSLDGRAGNDRLDGGAGNDQANYESSSVRLEVDLRTGQARQGSDTDTLISIENIGGTTVGDSIIGNDLNNQLLGRGGNDGLFGLGGDDVMFGGDGGDFLNGGAGKDILHGTAGADQLTGGTGADIFFYSDRSDSGTSLDADKITDFLKGVDKIDVGLIDANQLVAGNQAFTFIGQNNFTDEGQVRFFSTNAGTRIEFNTINNSGSEFDILLENTFVQHAASDFVL